MGKLKQMHLSNSQSLKMDSKNEEDLRLQLVRDLELFFSKFLKQTITGCLPVISVCCSITSDAQRTFVTLQFAHSMNQKLLNFG
jgi:hypothetical protein